MIRLPDTRKVPNLPYPACYMAMVPPTFRNRLANACIDASRTRIGRVMRAIHRTHGRDTVRGSYCYVTWMGRPSK